MNQGIEILLKRMESHPQEFDHEWNGDDNRFGPAKATTTYPVQEKWAHLLNQLRARVEWEQWVKSRSDSAPWPRPLPFLSTEEVMEAYEKFVNLQGDAFTRHVMRQLLEDKREDPRVGQVKWTNAQKYTVAATILADAEESDSGSDNASG